VLTFAELRRREFSRLDRAGHVYLDYTGSALYGESQIRAHQERLRGGIYGNPHSDSIPSRASTGMIDEARERVLRFLGVDSSTHEVIFTANTSAAIKLVAESYPFDGDSTCVLSTDNHNSVNGLREYARRAGARVQYLPLTADLRLDEHGLLPIGRGLIAFPAQSNFSGVRHPLTLVRRARDMGFDVLLDIAAMAASHPVSLRDCPADFAALSFYKLFGYPTGLGALIARRESLATLRRPWFAGGTVVYASVGADAHRLRRGHEAFEDGTADFLGIAALAAGFDLLEEVALPRVKAHVAALTAAFLEEIRSLPDVVVYGPADTTSRGGTVAFNIESVPYSEVERRATQANIAVRGGCFCNPGASEVAFGLDSGVLRNCFQFLGDSFTPDRFAACAGRPVGAVRISFGMANNENDVRRALELIRSVVASRPAARLSASAAANRGAGFTPGHR
jgi:selenocysteine lyase/cysteine desulfurase